MSGARAILLLVLPLAACGAPAGKASPFPGDRSTESARPADPGTRANEDALAAPAATPRFERLELDREFTAEGACFADLDRDGDLDVVAGPWWYEGPDFRARHAFDEPKTFDPKHYSDRFFAWPRDVDGDGWPDLVTVGFPGKQAYWYRNPLAAGDQDARWARSLVAEVVDNEAPAFLDLDGDRAPELLFHRAGVFGWSAPGADPRAPWTFHPISQRFEIGPFTHGLGAGDVDGDGRADVLWREGWFQQPASLAGDPEWRFHAFLFSDREGGAQMYVTDVDGDGDGDVITSLAAHHFGLSWFEQVREGAEITFHEHRIIDDEPSDNPQGVRVGELHAVGLADVDGDGLQDIVTGKRWWSHGAEGDPEPGASPSVWWFALRRTGAGASFEAHLADDLSGVGVQIATGDLDHDGLVDILTANKRGVFVLRQRRGAPPGGATMTSTRPPGAASAAIAPTLDFESGDLRGWTATGTAFDRQPVRGDVPHARGRESSRHQGERWIGGYEELGDKPRGTLSSPPIEITAPFASFLVGGGASYQTRVELTLADARAGEAAMLFTAGGTNSETMQRVAVDLSAHVGRKLVVRLVDEASGGWGHLNFDDFRFETTRPPLETPDGAKTIVPFDPVSNAGLAPEAARAAITVPAGFRVDLVASEPELHQPIALAIDDRGRLWVAEAFTYPVRAKDGEGRDDIVVFSDENGDGRFEKRTVFLEHLNLVSGLEVGFGGVWIGAAPNLLFVPDRDHDLVPDGPPEVVLDGFGFQDTHETLNAFQWGPDGWLYGCHGVFTDSKVGAPGTPAAQRVPIDAGVWRFHPTRRVFEVFAWGTSNPWGIDFDARGQAVITACVIPHLWHVIQGGRYERQSGNQFDEYAFEELGTIADHLHWTGVDPWAGNLRSGAAGGGHAHCGALIYQGGAFPPEYDGAILMNNIHGNRINVDRLERRGSGLVGHHAPDLLLANDRWFRGVALRLGPDGAVYLTDWYDQQACHLTKPEVWDRTNGRLYRVAYSEPRPAKIDLAALARLELVSLQESENDWHARHARRLLQERGPDAEVERALVAMFEGKRDERTRLRALWCLHAIGASSAVIARALRDEQEFVAAWAVQLACEDGTTLEREVLPELERLARESRSPVVRLYLASALQRLPAEQRWGIAAALAAHGEDADDPNLAKLEWYGIEPLFAADPARAFALCAASPLELLAKCGARRVASEPALHGELVRALGDPANAARLPLLLEAAQTALADQRGLAAPAGFSALYAKLARSSDRVIAKRARSLALAFGDPAAEVELAEVLADTKAPSEERLEALTELSRTRAGASAELLLGVLEEPAAPSGTERGHLRGAVLRALAARDDPRIAPAILAAWDSYDAGERRDALNTLSSRAASAGVLLDAVTRAKPARAELGAFVVRKIESLGDPRLAERLAAEFGRVQPTDEARAKRIAALEELVRRPGPTDRPRGREVFARTCEQCHTLFDAGGHVGPDLTGSNRADLAYLLSNVVDPNAVVGRDYLATLVWTKDGRLLTGIEKSRTDSAITLASENETIVIARADVEEEKLSDLSTMPEGLLDALAPDEIKDLVAYVQGAEQVPVRATRSNAARFFDGRTLAGWKGDSACWSVEDGEIVGRTSGLAKNEFLCSALELGDFRLSLEVRLAGDQGNSGIQFRTRAREGGEVEGFQADIGPGWWGKLYEENGRGLLAEPASAPRVQPGEWNRYVIEARGPRVRTSINGEPCVDLEDSAGARRGIVALQIHSGGATEVRFRGFELEVLD